MDGKEVRGVKRESYNLLPETEISKYLNEF